MTEARPPKALLFDIDGVFFVGDTPVPGGDEVLAWVERSGIPYLFVTNTTSHPRSYLADKLTGFGVSATPDQIVTPAVAARQWLLENDAAPVALFVPEETAEEFDGLPLAGDGRHPSSVVVGDLGHDWSFDVLNRAFQLLMTEPRPTLVSLGMTRYWRDNDGLFMDVGPFAQALAFATGTEPVVTGKPEPAFFSAAAHRLGVPESDVVMIGDDIRGDVEGAQLAGMRGLLVRTGKFHDSDLQLGIIPDAVLESVGTLPQWWRGLETG